MPSSEPVYYDPYRSDIVLDPYPTYKQLRQEAPVYYNAQYDVYVLSRYHDVRDCFKDYKRFSSARGGILEIVKADLDFPAGTFIFSDPPNHTAYRTIVQRIFSPKRMNGLEDSVRSITQDVLDQLGDRDEFDFVADIGTQVPMRVIGTLLGIPETDFQAVRATVDERLRTEEGQAMQYDEGFSMDESFQAYIDWRMKHPADDVITELLNVEFTDGEGCQRKLQPEELLTFVNVLAGAGNETTNKLIGWIGKTLAEHPDQRRDLVANPTLIPQAIEEVLRFEPTGPHVARWLTEEAIFHGQTIPANSAVLLLIGSANRDAEIFDQPDQFDIHQIRQHAHCTFGYGIHTCIGNVLARMEGRVVLQEVLKRYPDWEIDLTNAKLFSTSTVRGWESLPAYVNARGKQTLATKHSKQALTDNTPEQPPSSIAGTWQVQIKSPTGTMHSVLEIELKHHQWRGQQTGDGITTELENITYNANTGTAAWSSHITKPMKLTLAFDACAKGNCMTGKVKAGFMGSFDFSAVRSAEQ